MLIQPVPPGTESNHRLLSFLPSFWLSTKSQYVVEAYRKQATKRSLVIKRAVENLMYAHIHTPLPEQVQLVGENYILNGSKCALAQFCGALADGWTARKAWKYGQRLDLMCGDQRIEPCCDKWIF